MLAAADDTPLPFILPNIAGKKITAAFDGGRISSDGGELLPSGLVRAERLIRRRW